MTTKLSIVMPVYNECKLLASILQRVEAAVLPAGMGREIIIVDDRSTDGTREMLATLSQTRPELVIRFHEVNQGKGAALRTGFALATGDFVVVQEADLEYNPAEYPRLLEPLLDGRAEAVFGSRFIGETHRVMYYWHYLGNQWLTLLSNMCSNLNLTDMECCYKIFRRELLERFTIQENRFGFEPEVTAKVARLKARIYEVPVSYAGRTYEEGKKVNWRDGFSALRCIIKYNLGHRVPRNPRPRK